MSRRLRLAGALASLVVVLSSALVLWLDGHFAARVPAKLEGPLDEPLLELHDCVGRSGRVSRRCLVEKRTALEHYLQAVAATAPATAPDRFPGPDERVTFWLNTAHAMAMLQLAQGEDPGTLSARWLAHFDVGGQSLTRGAVERRFLSGTQDPRVMLALFTGGKGRGVLAPEPFFAPVLDAQLTEAARRFVQRPENVSLVGSTVHLSRLFHAVEDDILAVLPADRRTVLQFVWAFLPESCEGLAPGCLTRGDVDARCGQKLDQCTIAWEPVDTAPAVVD